MYKQNQKSVVFIQKPTFHAASQNHFKRKMTYVTSGKILALAYCATSLKLTFAQANFRVPLQFSKYHICSALLLKAQNYASKGSTGIEYYCVHALLWKNAEM